MDANPYSPPADVLGPKGPSHQAPSRGKRSVAVTIFVRFVVGFSLGSLPFVLLGAYGYYQFQAYVASLPPNNYVCGMGMMGPIMLVIVVAPLCGLITGVLAAAAGFAISGD